MRRFHQILDEEYRRAPEPPPERPRPRRRWRRAVLGMAAATLLTVPWALRTVRHRERDRPCRPRAGR
ncbi:hypothetical protein HUX53_03820 [Actinomadura sp. BRA 177]|nr:hypothetical protein [Actinomadura sp. BRA 177]